MSRHWRVTDDDIAAFIADDTTRRPAEPVAPEPAVDWLAAVFTGAWLPADRSLRDRALYGALAAVGAVVLVVLFTAAAMMIYTAATG